jgi:transposase
MVDYVDPGASYYDARYRERAIGDLDRRAKAFGFVL